MKQCPVCKMALPDDSDFCQYCGTKIIVPDSVQEKNGVSETTPSPETNHPADSSPKQMNPGFHNTAGLTSDKKETSIPGEGIDEPKKRSFGTIAWICAGVLIAALLVGNIIQSVNTQKKANQANSQITALEEEVRSRKEENDSLSNKIITLESEKHDLEEQAKSITTLENEKTLLENQISEWEAKGDEYNDLLTRILELNTEKTNLNSQISSLKQSNTSLRNQLNNLKSTSGKATTAYNAIKTFNYGTYYDDYHADTEIVVVKVGRQKTFHVTAKMNSNIYLYNKRNNYNSTGEWGKDWNNSTCSFYVTGETEGTTEYTFTNDANDHTFKVLVITIP